MSAVPDTFQRDQRVACDRCRGHKLRCIRYNQHGSCARCQRARATCVVNPSVRMGRPQRADKKHGGPESSQRSRLEHPQEKPSNNLRVLSQADNRSPTTHNSIWLNNGSEEVVESGLVGDPYSQSLDFALNDGALDDGEMQMPAPDLLHEEFNFGAPRPLTDIGMYAFDSEAINDLLDPCKDFVPTESHTPNGDNTAVETPNSDIIIPASSSSSHSAVEKLSDLNVQIHRRLTTKPNSLDTNSADHRSQLSRAVEAMIQGLQTFHELLKILTAASHHSPQATILASQKNDTRLQGFPASPNAQHSMGSMSSHEDVDTVSLTNTNSETRHNRDGPPQVSWLDLPTSLLVLTCYANLLHFCREVFAAIRGAMRTPGHQETLLELSGLHLGGVAVHEDSDLQIMILTKVVTRLIDGIQLCTSHSQTFTAVKDRSDSPGKAILPQLLHLVLGPKRKEGQSSCKGLIEELREAIRYLSESVRIS